MSNLRFALRQLLKSPGFAATAILTLAIAIAVNATVFAVMRVVLYAPVAKVKSEEVTGIFPNRPNARGNDYRRVSYAEYVALREAKDVLREVVAIHPTLVGVGEGTEAKRSLAVLVSDQFFAFHGVALRQGRGFTTSECQPGAAQNVVVLSYAYWERLGRRSDLIGSTLRISSQTFTVVGVAPRSFSGINALIMPDFYFPLGVFTQLAGGLVGQLPPDADVTNPSIFPFSIWARIAPGLTLETAKVRLPDLTARMRAAAPPTGTEAEGEPRKLEFGEHSRFGMSDSPDEGLVGAGLAVVLQGMAVLVLLVASLNLANLLLARGAVRRREIAVRMAVGASRGHIVRQLLAEGAVLAVAGGLLGAWLGSLGLQALMVSLMNSVAPVSFGFSLAFDARPDLGLTLAVAALCGGATLVFSLGPALSLSRRDLSVDIRTGASPEGVERRGWLAFFGTRNLLVATQLALALALLFTATQFFRGGLKMARQPFGFQPEGIAVMEVDYALAKVPRTETAARFRELSQRIQALPGVLSVNWSTLVPFDNSDFHRRAVGLGPQAVEPPAGKAPGSYGLFAAVEDGYFQQMAIPIVAGREFTAAEAQPGSQAKVAVIDEKLARRLFKDGIGLGRRIRVNEGERVLECEVVGVIRSPWHGFTGDAEPPSRLYLPFAQETVQSAFLTIKLQVRERAAVAGMLQTIRREVSARDRSALVLQAMPLTDFVARNANFWLLQATAVLFGVFAAVALILAVVGVYGVAAYLVARRTKEIGLRMALGATAHGVLQLVLGQSARQALFAITAGVLFAIGLAGLLGSQLAMLPPIDALGLAACAAVLFAAAVLAGLPPARRAARIQPSVALKAE